MGCVYIYNIYGGTCIHTHSSLGFPGYITYMGGCVYTHTHTRRWTSLVAQSAENLPAVQKTQVQSLGQEDPLQKGITTHSSIFAWRIPRREEPGGLHSRDCKESDTT